jgi:hypothetical protein
MSDPTQAELAALTATLATGTERTVDEFHRLAERALNLWHGAGWALQICKERRENPERLRAEWNTSFRRAGLEPPEVGRTFKLAKALAFLMPSKGVPERMKALRDFLTATVESDLSPQEAVPCEIEALRERGFNYGQFCRFAERFLPWLESDARRKKALAGGIGGKARPAKKKRER